MLAQDERLCGPACSPLRRTELSAAPDPCLSATTQPASRVPDMQLGTQLEDFDLLSDGIASSNA